MSVRRKKELLDAPNYTIAEVAEYIGVPTSTVHAWTNPRLGGRAIIAAAASTGLARLSFANLLEAHILSALRRHRLSMQRIRSGIEFLETKLTAKDAFLVAHPLLGREFKTDGRALLVEHLGSTIDTKDGQHISATLVRYIERIDFEGRLPSRLFPFTRSGTCLDQPRSVVIDPSVAFGRPVLNGTGIPVDEIAGRHKAGDSIHDIASDFDRTPEEIEEALRFNEAA